MHQKKLEAELTTIEEKYENKKKRFLESSEEFQVEIKKHCVKAVDDDKYNKMVEEQVQCFSFLFILFVTKYKSYFLFLYQIENLLMRIKFRLRSCELKELSVLEQEHRLHQVQLNQPIQLTRDKFSNQLRKWMMVLMVPAQHLHRLQHMYFAL